MAKKGENRELVTLKCTVCNEKNYRNIIYLSYNAFVTNKCKC